MFRDLIPLLSDRSHLVAPDLPGFGQSALPPRERFTYSFEALAKTISRFTEVIGLRRFALYVFDYGAPTGFRLALAYPDRVTAIISQNGNAYEEGLSEGWNPIQRCWRDPSVTNRAALREMLTPRAIRWQYEHGVSDPTAISRGGSTLDACVIQRLGVDDIQLDLFLDDASNVALYPAFQSYFRKHQPRLLAIWAATTRSFFRRAETYKRDLPHAEIRFLDTGHFALEIHACEIAQAVGGFLQAG